MILSTVPHRIPSNPECRLNRENLGSTFCAPIKGIDDATSRYVNAYPAAWRIETVNDEIHRGFEHVRSELYVARDIETTY